MYKKINQHCGETKICSVDGCNSPIRGKGLCLVHYFRDRRKQKAAAKKAKMPNIEKQLYEQAVKEAVQEAVKRVFLTEYPVGKLRSRISTGKYKMISIPEHRLVAERALGKALPPGSIVHHINLNKQDNRQCNLVVCPNNEYHMLIHKLQAHYNYYGTQP